MGRIFDPFFTTKPIGAGAGLGLSVVHTIVSGLGGHVEVENAHPRGTIFRVLLPADLETPGPSSVAPLPYDKSVRAKVLIVDDEEAVGAALGRALSGHEITLAKNGREGLALCRSASFDCILCDVMMPDLDGVDFFEALAGEGKGQERRVVFMTGGAFTARAREFLSRVPNACIEKPFEMPALQALIERMASEEG
jgi:two-component system, cell cycle sensor histidine kinase and response regulator CckA